MVEVSGACTDGIPNRDITRKERQVDTHRQVMQDYLDALVKRADFSRYFASDVVATIEGTDQRADGREPAEQMIRYIHE